MIKIFGAQEEGKEKKVRKRRRKSERARREKNFDDRWSILTKNIHGRVCKWCGSTKKIQSDHLVTRKNKRTRWRVDNVIILCYPCHFFRKKSDPLGWYEVVSRETGEGFLEALRAEANKSTMEKVDLDEVDKYLTEIEAQYGEKEEA